MADIIATVSAKHLSVVPTAPIPDEIASSGASSEVVSGSIAYTSIEPSLLSSQVISPSKSSGVSLYQTAKAMYSSASLTKSVLWRVTAGIVISNSVFA